MVSALYAVFAAGGTLRMEDLSAEIARTRPLSSTMQERIQALRDWSQGRTVSAHYFFFSRADAGACDHDRKTT